MDVIDIDPSQLLEDGLRKGICHRITAAMATCSAWPSSCLQPLAACESGYGAALPSVLSLFGGRSPEGKPDRCVIPVVCTIMWSI